MAAVYAYATSDGRGQVLTMLGFTLPEAVSSLIPTGKFFAEIPAERVNVLDLDALVYLDYGTKVAEDTAFRSLAVSRENRVTTIDRTIGNAMSMPNPVTIEWVLQQLPPLVRKLDSTLSLLDSAAGGADTARGRMLRASVVPGAAMWLKPGASATTSAAARSSCCRRAPFSRMGE